ncbi:MAG TPA: 2Fe-2S iron-sulfur cluster-binding protein [Vicinamibacteria bacterium]|nr:2Fe-2S iron-sulfur cluster-binding protein [Vicinamibacteria bacterium]
MSETKPTPAAKPDHVRATIDGKAIEVPKGTTVIQAAAQIGIDIPRFCYHEDLPIDGNCRMCLVEVEKMPKLQIACNTQVTEGMVVHTESDKAKQAHRTTLEFLLVNHPIDCPVCDQAGECYLQDQYMDVGLHDSKVEPEEKVHKRKVVDLGPIMLDAERCVLCSRCLRFEEFVTGTNSFEFRNRGDHTQIATFEDRPITHNYAWNLADVCPVGALLSHDFRFKMRVWFLEETESVCPGCSTGCNIYVDHRDEEVHRLRPRRNVEVNKSWMCDIGRVEYKEIALETRVSAARVRRGAGWEETTVATALDLVTEKILAAPRASAFLATPQATNEDVYMFRLLSERAGGMLDFRVGNPQDKTRVQEDNVLLRADRNPNTTGCLDQGIGRDGVDAILKGCASEAVKVLVLQGAELLADPGVAAAAAKVPFVAVMASHEHPELAKAHCVLPAAVWAEVDGTFTNYQRRVQRIKRAVAPPGAAVPRWELAAGLVTRLGEPIALSSARDVFALIARDVKVYSGLDHRLVGATGRALDGGPPPREARV